MRGPTPFGGLPPLAGAPKRTSRGDRLCMSSDAYYSPPKGSSGVKGQGPRSPGVPKVPDRLWAPSLPSVLPLHFGAFEGVSKMV